MIKISSITLTLVLLNGCGSINRNGGPEYGKAFYLEVMTENGKYVLNSSYQWVQLQMKR